MFYQIPLSNDFITVTDPSEPITGDDSSVNKALQSFHFLEEEDYHEVAYFGVQSYDSCSLTSASAGAGSGARYRGEGATGYDSRGNDEYDDEGNDSESTDDDHVRIMYILYTLPLYITIMYFTYILYI
jgi:hypothetical protein